MIFLVFIALSVFTFVLYLKTKIIELLSVIVVFFSYPFSAFLKVLFEEKRPQGSYLVAKFYWDRLSFPSSHVFVSTVLIGFLIYLVIKLKLLKFKLEIISVFLGLGVIMLIAWTRVYLGVHYIHDVIGGFVLGALYLGFTILIDKTLERKLK